MKFPSVTICNDGVFLEKLLCYKGYANGYGSQGKGIIGEYTNITIPCSNNESIFTMHHCIHNGNPGFGCKINTTSSNDNACITVNPTMTTVQRLPARKGCLKLYIKTNVKSKVMKDKFWQVQSIEILYFSEELESS